MTVDAAPRGVRTRAIAGGLGLLTLAGCGDVLGFKHGTEVACLGDSDCEGGLVCKDNECAPAPMVPDGGVAPDGAAMCQAACAPPNLCVAGVCRQGEAGPPSGNGDTGYSIDPDKVACSQIEVSTCEWITGIGARFAVPVDAPFRFGLYADYGGYPSARLTQTDEVPVAGTGGQPAAVAPVLPLGCGDGSVLYWLCIATTAEGFASAATSNTESSFTATFQAPEQIQEWVSTGMPDAWPSSDHGVISLPLTLTIYPWIVPSSM